MSRKEFEPIAIAAAQKYGIDPDIFVKQINQESGFNPKAVSPAGAVGIAQIMPQTAKGWKVDPTDPIAALDAAARNMANYFKTYKNQGRNDLEAYALALSAYNAGPGNVQKYGGVPPFKETQNYVKRILGDRTPSNKPEQPTQTTSTTSVSPSEPAPPPFQIDISTGKASLSPEEILARAHIRPDEVRPKELELGALEAAQRFTQAEQNKPDPLGAFLKSGVASSPLSGGYDYEPKPGEEFAAGLGDLTFGVGGTLGATTIGGPAAGIAYGGGTFGKQAFREGGSPEEIAVRSLLGAGTTALPFGMTGNLLKRSVTGGVVGGGSVAVDELARRASRGEPLEGVLTDPNVGYGTGFGAVLSALLGGKGRVPRATTKQGEVVQTKALPETKVKGLLTGEVLEEAKGPVTDGPISQPGETLGGILPETEPSALKQLTTGGEVSTPKTTMDLTIEGRGSQLVRPTKHGGLTKPIDVGGTVEQSTQGVLLKGLGTSETPEIKLPVRNRVSEAVIIDLKKDVDGTYKATPETFNSPTLAKKYARRLSQETGLDSDEIVIETRGRNTIVRVEPVPRPPEIRNQLDQAVSEYQTRVAQMKQEAINTHGSNKAEVLLAPQLKKAYRDLQRKKEQILSQTPLVEAGSTSISQEGLITHPTENNPLPETSLNNTNQLDPRPSVPRRGGMTIPGERGTFHNMEEIQRYQPGLIESMSPMGKTFLEKTFGAIESGKAVSFTYNRKVKGSSNINPVVFPSHIDATGNTIRLIGRNADGDPGNYIIEDLLDKGTHGIASEPVLVDPNPKHYRVESGTPGREERTLLSPQITTMRTAADKIRDLMPRNRVAERILKLIHEKESTTSDYMRAMKLIDQLPSQAKKILEEEFKELC